MSRRRLAAAVAGVWLVAGSVALAAPLPFPVTEVASGIFVRQGVHQDATAENDDAIANIGFIVGLDAVAVVDPGGSLDDGERLRATVQAKTDRPIRYVVMTHAHPDHIFGGIAFMADHPVFVGHARLAGVLIDRGEYYRKRLVDLLGRDRAGDYEMPTLLVTDTAALDLGGRVLELQAHGAAHTDNDLTILDRQTGTLWAADLLFVDRVPAIDGSLAGWLKELAALKALPATRAVPGHGPPVVPWPAGAADEERYLTVLATEIRALLAKGGDIETAVEQVGLGERGKWQLFDEYNGRNVTAAFKELEWD
ncbi:MAG TPA: quinoprotein relay system zinc metallohydrolase 2 [Aliidongia sp.]|uniref:quinoprotein relay system zinc metallohydrolase 2 n=1 Tax=Aliidongia sp. TaxID=1914230 RepID=UPI002DDD7865|nr:quinoprotein relay system zinc metallohydrolase 2 [Aliidongia sp.]HEV2677445.1 quinoprotein relay system zinc metallohydrolase 2 [Aliidongia sp.]